MEDDRDGDGRQGGQEWRVRGIGGWSVAGTGVEGKGCRIEGKVDGGWRPQGPGMEGTGDRDG